MLNLYQINTVQEVCKPSYILISMMMIILLIIIIIIINND